MVSIDRVYQTVLTLVNKEGMGYVTPQEFNLFANQAQIDIFERYFADEYREETKPDNGDKYALPNVMEKIAIFNVEDPLEFDDVSETWRFKGPTVDTEIVPDGVSQILTGGVEVNGTFMWPLDQAFDDISSVDIGLFLAEDPDVTAFEISAGNLGRIVSSDTDLDTLTLREIQVTTSQVEAWKLISLYAGDINVNEVDRQLLAYMLRSPLTAPSASQPVYYRVNESEGALSDVKVYPLDSAGVSAYYIRKPLEVSWSVADENKIDFELHASEFPELVVKILAYVGIELNRAEIVQAATGAEQSMFQANQ